MYVSLVGFVYSSTKRYFCRPKDKVKDGLENLKGYDLKKKLAV